MKVVEYSSESYDTLRRKHLRQTGQTLDPDHTVVFLQHGQVVGYCVYYRNKTEVFVDWFQAQGHGKSAWSKLERAWTQSRVRRVRLNCSVDPTEPTSTVMKRINFWFGRGFKVHKIRYRKDHGPLLGLHKALSAS